MAAASIREVARPVGVSAGTVSKLLTHAHAVIEATRRRVEAAVGEPGFVRESSAVPRS